MALEDGMFAVSAPQLARLLSLAWGAEAGDAHSLLGDQLVHALLVDVARGVDQRSVALRRAWFGRNAPSAPPQRPSRARIALRVVFRGDAPTIVVFLLACQLAINVVTRGDNWGELACVVAFAVALTAIKAHVALQNEQHARQVVATQRESVVRVWRDGRDETIASADLVVGDVVHVCTGDVVPADGLLVDADEPVEVDESAITGESNVVAKSALANGKDAVLWAGTGIQRGRGHMMVVCVGEHTMEGLMVNLINGKDLPKEEKIDHQAYTKLLSSPSSSTCSSQGGLEELAAKYHAVQTTNGKDATKDAKPVLF